MLIFIIGMPGSGKTTIGRILAKRLKYEFLDLDKLIVKDNKKSIIELFELGEDVFRLSEHEALKSVSENINCVVSTGGGIIEKNENLEILKKGTVILILRSLKNIQSTLNTEKRPLIKNNPDKLNELYIKRKNKYFKAADYIITNNSNLYRSVDKIVKIIKK